MNKRMLQLIVTSLLAVSLFANGAKEQKGAEEATANNVAYEVTEPVTLTVWHPRGVGVNEDMIESSVQEFNATNKYGITVEQEYQGNYPTTLAKIMQSIPANTNPQIVVLERAAGVPVIANEGLLLDLVPYIERDGFDMNNFYDSLLGYSYYENQIISLPYVRSTPILYYNKDMLDAAGLKVPTTIKELEEVGKKLTKRDANGKVTVHGFQMCIDAGWFIQNMTCQLGSNMMSEDGLSSPCLEDGTLEKVLTAWRSWVDDGWCASPTVTDPSPNMKQDFYEGRLAMFFESTGGLTNISKNSAQVGINFGTAFLPTWDIPTAPTGGGNIAILNHKLSNNEKAASWEFIKFLMGDNQIIKNSINTGYVPTTKTAAKDSELIAFWKEMPQAETGFKQLAQAQEIPWSKYKAQIEDIWNVTCSNLIIDRGITAKQAIDNIKKESAIIFPAK